MHFKRLSGTCFLCQAAELEENEAKSSKLKFLFFFLFVGWVVGGGYLHLKYLLQTLYAPFLDCKLFEGSPVGFVFVSFPAPSTVPCTEQAPNKYG